MTHPKKNLAILLSTYTTILALSACTTSPAQSAADTAQAAQPPQTTKTEAITKSPIAPSSTLKEAISTDGFALHSDYGLSHWGDGSGDLVLVVHDPIGLNGISKRKRSILVDLSLQINDSKTIDLTYRELLLQQEPFTINLAPLSNFILQSENIDKLQWQVFAIGNHITGDIRDKNLTYVNFGLMTTIQADAPTEQINNKDIQIAKAYKAELIMNNNTYGIKPNGYLESRVGEQSYLDTTYHKNLGQSIVTLGEMGNKLALVSFETYLEDQKAFKNRVIERGDMTLGWDEETKTLQLTFEPK